MAPARALRVRLQEARYKRTRCPKSCAEQNSVGAIFSANCHLNDVYRQFYHYYCCHCPDFITAHREYFKQNRRGFGEDAFHAFWWLLLSEYRPTTALEIGVYRGQVLSLWALIAKRLGMAMEVHGVSPFKAIGDSVSTYSDNGDYMDEVRRAVNEFGGIEPVLVRALSTDANGMAHIRGRTWDLIYIDGNHDFDVVLSDYRVSRDSLRPGGLLVMDDASLGGEFRPPLFAFAGHPGPSQVAREYASRELRCLGSVGHLNVFQKSE
jgi:cephalosporin hydroxylase